MGVLSRTVQFALDILPVLCYYEAAKTIDPGKHRKYMYIAHTEHVTQGDASAADTEAS